MPRAKLTEYTAKRRFDVTPEPKAADTAPAAGPLLFVVQQHSARKLHYDLRLECDGVLKSWAVPKGPSLDTNDKRLAVQTEDHPYDYGSFEGVIPPGQYGAGEVIVWDCGLYSPDEGNATWFHDRERAEREVRDGLAKGKLSFQLRGVKLKGSFALVRSRDAKQWLLIKHKDRYAAAVDVTQRNTSVLSGVAVEDMKQVPAHRIVASRLAPSGTPVPMPAKLEPMHAESADAAFNHPDWMWEPKLDGYRVVAFVGEKGVKLQSRRGQDLTPAFPRIVKDLESQLVRGMLLDGEIVAFDAGGRASFNALQNRAGLKTARELEAADRTTPAIYCVFDLLHFAGIDVRKAPYRDRRRWLAQCLLPTPHLQLVHSTDDGEALHAAALASGFEGVMGKHAGSAYESGRRSGKWLKVKPFHTAEFVVGGWTEGEGSRTALGAIVVGYWADGKFRFSSKVGSGFDSRNLPKLQALLEPLRRRTCPFAEKPDTGAPTTWVEPEVVVEVKFQSWTDDGKLRAPVFLRIRDDVDPASVRRVEAVHRIAQHESRERKPVARKPTEIDDVLVQLQDRRNTFVLRVGAHDIRLTHLDRVYWPANAALKTPPLTKRDLLRYLAQVSPAMLPHLADRPVTMIRMPDGIDGQRFYQKHWAQAKPPFVETIELFSRHHGESGEYLLCNNLPTLLWLAQSGTLEFHVWHSRTKPGPDAASKSTDFSSSLDAIEQSILAYPDWVVFDLDPYIYSGKEAKGAEPELNTTAFEKGKEVAFWLRELLAGMSLDAIVKTSGKTGLHIFVPIRRTLDFEATRHVSELVGRHLMQQHPKDITMDWAVPKRTGRIFMDYNMNVRGKTLNSAYSPRGAPGGPVSMPLTWDELANAHPLDFLLTNAAERVLRLGDRWKDALKKKQSLEKALRG